MSHKQIICLISAYSADAVENNQDHLVANQYYAISFITLSKKT